MCNYISLNTKYIALQKIRYHDSITVLIFVIDIILLLPIHYFSCKNTASAIWYENDRNDERRSPDICLKYRSSNEKAKKWRQILVLFEMLYCPLGWTENWCLPWPSWVPQAETNIPKFPVIYCSSTTNF